MAANAAQSFARTDFRDAINCGFCGADELWIELDHRLMRVISVGDRLVANLGLPVLAIGSHIR